MKNNKKIAMVCFFLATLGILSGCGTVHGFGKDVARTGHEIEKATR
jgi:predicted small secreted protein